MTAAASPRHFSCPFKLGTVIMLNFVDALDVIL